MKPNLILAIDQGTTNSKAILVDQHGAIVAKGQAPVAISHPQAGWVEQDPEQIWQSVKEAITNCLGQSDPKRILAIGISNQRESILAWDANSGQALGPCITWQCRRTESQCEALRKRGLDQTIKEKTGLPIDPLFPATKAAWLMEQIAPTSKQKVLLGTVDSWLLWKLTNGAVHACDTSNASRTQLFNIQTCRWDSELCEWFNVPIKSLPAVKPSNGHFGATSAQETIPDGIPIFAMIGDSHAALFGHGIHQPGQVKATYGTGSSLMTPLEKYVLPAGGITCTVAWSMGEKTTYALEGNILVSASSLPVAAEWFGLGQDPAQVAELATTVGSSEGVYFIPALVGLGAPYWNANARGLFCGISFNTRRAHLARAVLESIAYQVLDVFRQMQTSAPKPLTALLADGGPSQNNELMQFQSDILELPVIQCDTSEVSALGAAMMAGLGVGLWRDSNATAALAGSRKTLYPATDDNSPANKVAGWHQAVQRALLFEKD